MNNAFAKGHEEGFEAGREEGFEAGREEGYERGHEEGFEAGLHEAALRVLAAPTRDLLSDFVEEAYDFEPKRAGMRTALIEAALRILDEPDLLCDFLMTEGPNVATHPRRKAS